MTEFSNDELLLLSACVLKTISDMHEAKKSIIGYEVKNKIEEPILYLLFFFVGRPREGARTSERI